MTSLVASTRQNLDTAQRAVSIAQMHAAEELARIIASRKPTRLDLQRARDIASDYRFAKQREAEAWARYRSAIEQAPQPPIYA